MLLLLLFKFDNSSDSILGESQHHVGWCSGALELWLPFSLFIFFFFFFFFFFKDVNVRSAQCRFD